MLAENNKRMMSSDQVLKMETTCSVKMCSYMQIFASLWPLSIYQKMFRVVGGIISNFYFLLCFFPPWKKILLSITRKTPKKKKKLWDGKKETISSSQLLNRTTDTNTLHKALSILFVELSLRKGISLPKPQNLSWATNPENALKMLRQQFSAFTGLWSSWRRSLTNTDAYIPPPGVLTQLVWDLPSISHF